MSEILSIKEEVENLGGNLVAVSKTFSSDRIKEVYAEGFRSFGENYLNEALGKIEDLKNLDIEWHFLGRVQSGTINKLIDKFHLIHTITKISHLKKINDKSSKKQRVLIQLRHDSDDRDYGVLEKELFLICKESLKFSNIILSGLMFIPPVDMQEDKIKDSFLWAKLLFEKIKEELDMKDMEFDVLSMGMSADYKIALQNGSSHVRIGRAIFGNREYKD